MTTIVQTVGSAANLFKAATLNVLNGASDILTFAPQTGQVLILANLTAGSIGPVTVIGSTATTVAAPGVKPVDASTGLNMGSLAAAQWKLLQLDNAKGYLQGVVSITGGSGLTAVLADGG